MPAETGLDEAMIRESVGLVWFDIRYGASITSCRSDLSLRNGVFILMRRYSSYVDKVGDSCPVRGTDIQGCAV